MTCFEMGSLEFKKAWQPDDNFRWTDIDPEELAQTDLSDQTKSFLAKGFPEDAAPFLNFGLRSYDWKFYNMETYPHYSHHQLGSIGRHFWLFGSDGSGNPICLDSAQHDRIILLDHESGFEIMDTMNDHVVKLAQSLLLYRNFINTVNREYGEDGFFDVKYTLNHVSMLKDDFLKINPKLFDNSSFWEQELDMLSEEAST